MTALTPISTKENMEIGPPYSDAVLAEMRDRQPPNAERAMQSSHRVALATLAAARDENEEVDERAVDDSLWSTPALAQAIMNREVNAVAVDASSPKKQKVTGSKIRFVEEIRVCPISPVRGNISTPFTSLDVEALMCLADEHCAQGEFMKALRVYREAEKILSLYRVAHPIQKASLGCMIGSTLMNVSRNEDAIEVLESAYAIHHEDHGLTGIIGYNLGNAYFELGHLAAAESALLRAIPYLNEEPRTQCKTWGLLGNLCLARGDQEEARKYFQAAYESPRCPSKLKESIERWMNE